MTKFLSDMKEDALKTGAMLEVGFEDGSGVRAFLDAGWTKVHAIDMDKRCLPMIQDEVNDGRAEVQIGLIQDENIKLTPDMDVINAHYVLPFVPNNLLPRVLERFYNTTRSGGYLLCAFMGKDDEGKRDKKVHSWNGRPGIHVYTKSEIEELLTTAGYENIYAKPLLRENTQDQGGNPVPVWYAFIVRAQKPEIAGEGASA